MRIRKLVAVALAALALVMTFVACGDKEHEKDLSASVFPVSSYNDTVGVTMGDVMPFYDDGVMNIYHLQNSRGTLSTYYHPISRLTTTDFLHYTDEGIAIPFEENYKSPDAAIGTGSFIKDENGVYHCFYTGHNAEENTGLPYFEVVRHAVSKDQETWTKVEDFNLYGYSNDFRDPYVYYDSYDACYYMLVTTNDGGRGVIKRYSSTSLDAVDDEWIDRGVFFANDDGTYNMECPSYVEYNGYWYLAYSEQGENRVTHYRYRTERNGEWKKFERDSIDASGFYAGRLEKAGDDLYAFAWCATLTGGAVGEFDWGGNLVTHQILQKSNGELCAVLVSGVEEAVNSEKEYAFADGGEAGDVAFDGSGFASRAVFEIPEGIVRMSFDVTVNGYGGNFGLTFGLKKGLNDRLGEAVVAFDPAGNKLTCYNDVSSIVRYGDPLANVDFVYMQGKTYSVDVLIDGEVLTVYFDDTVAVTARFVNMEDNYFAFYSNGVNVKFGGISFYE